jgi:hypothetical protein
MVRKLATTLLLLLLPTLAAAQNKPVKQVRDAEVTGNVRWSADTVYVLNGFVFVEDGGTLTIEAGTVIKGKPGQGENASALIIARGGKIFARGTPAKPIIFTAESDNVDDLTDLPPNTRGQWGGVIILGKARINVAGGEENIEGIPITEPRGLYGGTDDDDDSGVFRYVSLRYGGTNIGANNEINGLTMGAVGRKTVIEYVEVFNNADDGYEWFGGTVNTRYLVSAFNDDDGFDYDEGFRGKGQFWFLIQDPVVGGSGGEHDGGTTPEDGQPYAIPVVYNATYIGSGATSTNARNDFALNIRDNAGGKYYNSIFTDFFGRGVQIDSLPATGENSQKRLQAGDIALQNNIFFGFGTGSGANQYSAQLFTRNYLNDAANNNRFVNPQLRGISRTNDKGLDPRPGAGSPALTGAATASDPFFQPANYVGAFGPDNLWIDGWTFLSRAGYVRARGSNVVNVTDADIGPGQNVVWTADKTYLLNGFVFVEDGATLTIEAGTVIKGKPGQGENSSALIIARGGKIFANGTATNPIIFTAEADDVDDLNDLPPNTRGQWGGVIILGKAVINVAGGEENIEGIPVTEIRGLYGGTDDDDDSGVFRYVSLRYGGTNIGANNEINGLTMGAVGRKTVIEYVEVFNNADDGYEWFGGTVNTRYLVSAFNDDDGFDWDEGFRGKGQFWFLIQDPIVGGSGGEHDGGTTPEDGQPYAIPIVYNSTYIGSGATSTNARNDFALNIRDNSGGKYYNSIFTDFFGRGVQIDSLPATGENSQKRLQAGDIALQNNIFFGFGTGSGGSQYSAQLFTRNYLNDAANNNRFVNPQLRGISRTTNRSLDPRPQSGSPALTGARSIPAGDDFFVSANYVGAFGTHNWAADWTFISQIGILTTDGAGLPTRVQERKVPGTIPTEYTLGQNYPNPFNPSTKIDYAVPKTGTVKLEVYNMLGQKVATLVEGIRTAGNYTVSWNAAGVTSGMYFYRLEASGVVQTRKMLLTR